MIQTKTKIVKQLWPKGLSSNNFRIFSCELVEKNSEIKLNKWGNFALKGPFSFLISGQIYDLCLEEMESDPKYGPTYTISSVPQIDLTDMPLEMQHQLLSSITSKTIFKNTIAVYPNFVQMILDGKDDEIDISKIKGMGEGRFETYKNFILSNYKIFAIQSQFSEWEITTEETKKLVSVFQTVQRIKEELENNPYKICIDYLHRPFTRTDEFILKRLPNFTESKERAEYYIQHVLKLNEQDGSTYLKANTMIQYIPKNLWQFVVGLVKNNPRFHYDEGTKTVALGKTFSQERIIAETLMGLFYSSYSLNLDTKNYRNTDKYKLSNNQYSFLEMFNNFNISVLIGPAGTGKSTTMESLTKMLTDNHIDFKLLAPTGIAAKKLQEVTGFESSTIHSACFKDKEFESKVIIVDEVSMISIELMAMLCEKIDTSYHKLVLIGDPSQLPSIGCGNVLKDIIDSKMIPYVILSKVFRFGIGGIATVTTNIREGKPYLDDSGNLLFNMKNVDYRFIPINNSPMEQVFTAYKELLKKYSYKEILILTPFNRGEYGTRLINNEIQALYNPKEDSQPLVGYRSGKDVFTSFNVGDKVIHAIKNDYHALTREEYEYNEDTQHKMENDLLPDDFKPKFFPQTIIVNGDIGYVKEVHENRVVYVEYSHATIVYTPKTLRRLLLAQSITIHKAQGSEAKAVILFTHPSQQKMLNRNLLYTATSRAKEVLIQIGDPQLINKAIKINASEERKTWLKQLLQKEDIIDEANSLD